MNGNNQEYNAEAMLDYLDGLDPRVRQKGEALFAARRVRDLGPVEDTSDFAAVVVDGGEHVAILEHDFEFGWSGTCDCEDEFDCEHACAVMLAMLRKLGISPRQSRAKPRQPAPPSPASKPAAQKPAGSMAGELTAALGRPLNAAEQRFLKGLSQTFARVQATHHLSYWDLDNLGLQTGGHSWDRLDIWPRLPKDERQFWNYLANAVLESGHSIPGFMEPVTDFASVREELAAWRRQRQIDQWRNLLAAAPPADGLAAAPRRVDLRLVLGWDGAELEWKQDSDASYRQLRLNNFQQLLLDRAHGQVELSPASEHLCSAFEIRVAHGRNPKIPYEEPGTRDLLSRLLRAPDLEALIVSADRQPLRRPTEP
ncbi:MAG: hypothetical protein KDM81_11555, partial [Verrucomicrobiae bacterium]|nr:hypothetical protein [Verrucomicrobiae bacterium]